MCHAGAARQCRPSQLHRHACYSPLPCPRSAPATTVADATSCLPCAGSVHPQLTLLPPSASPALFAQLNFYRPTTGATSCLPCPRGQETHDQGNTECTPCAVGYLNNKEGAHLLRPAAASLPCMLLRCWAADRAQRARGRQTTTGGRWIRASSWGLTGNYGWALCYLLCARCLLSPAPWLQRLLLVQARAALRRPAATLSTPPAPTCPPPGAERAGAPHMRAARQLL